MNISSIFFFSWSAVVFPSSTEDSIQIRSYQIEVLLIGLKIDQLSESAGSFIAVATENILILVLHHSEVLMWLYGD